MSIAEDVIVVLMNDASRLIFSISCASEGNKLFLRDKAELRQRYKEATTKSEKTEISQELVNLVGDRGGRFLKLNKATKKWEEVDYETSRKKASQALREDSTPESRRAKRAKYGKRR